ncbi:hypothetical protein SAMN06265222_1461 [Neorhodopirellula lusitana]|uniref:Uncharacterized protein n=1 Tax=Neorhodopirellula lusitana TaxID=445327 RepID=A0ABY1QU74_9BACT|nr:hypothetical protein SAMN06265222_1461 [Neorhodopirellula lusitana]
MRREIHQNPKSSASGVWIANANTQKRERRRAAARASNTEVPKQIEHPKSPATALPYPAIEPPFPPRMSVKSMRTVSASDPSDARESLALVGSLGALVGSLNTVGRPTEGFYDTAQNEASDV